MPGRRVRSGVLQGPSPFDAGPFDAGTGPDGDDAVYAPSRFDPVARAASTVIGGPAGRRLASAGGFWRAASVLVLLACVMLSFGLVQKQHCRAQGWSTPDQFWHACYSDIPVLYSSAQLGAAHPPSLMHQLQPGSGLSQAPLPGALMWVMASVTPNHGASAGRVYFDASAALLAFLLVVAVAAVAFTARRRSWDAAHLALSPVLISAGLISYELLAVTLAALALLALSRGRTLLSGVLVGLGIACAPQLALIALAVALLSLSRRHQHHGAGAALAVTAAASWFVVRVALLPGYTGGLSDAFSGWHKAVPGYGSLWLVPQLLKASHPRPATSLFGRGVQGIFGWLFAGGALSGHTASILAVVLLIILGGMVIGLTVVAADAAQQTRADQAYEAESAEPGSGPDLESAPALQPESSFAEFVTTRVAPLSLALVAAALITAKSLPVQVSLLLLPLIALSGLRWSDHLIWAGTELVYFVGVWLYIGGESIPNRGLPASFYVVLLVARLAGIAWVGIQGVLIFRAADRACGQPGDGTPPVDKISAPDDDTGRLLVVRGVSAPHHAG